MSKIILIISLILYTISLNAAEKVRIGTFMLPPFMMEVGADKKPGGAAIDYWEKYIAPKMNAEVEAFGPFPILRVTKMLEDGQIDVITNMTKIPQRETIFIYPETNMSEIASCLIVLEESPLKKVTGQKDLLNLRIGFIEGGFIPQLFKHEKIFIEMTANTDFREILFNKLMAKRYDAFLDINYMSLLYYLKGKEYKNRVRTILLPIEKIKVYSVFQKSERGKRLSKMFDKINSLYYKTDIYNNLARKYLE